MGLDGLADTQAVAELVELVAVARVGAMQVLSFGDELHLIVAGDATLAGSQRAAVDRLVAPRIHQGQTVWAGGQWAFMHYAQRAGALPLGNTPPLPYTGDIIVVSRLDYYGRLDEMPFRRDLLYTDVDRRCGFSTARSASGSRFGADRHACRESVRRNRCFGVDDRARTKS